MIELWILSINFLLDFTVFKNYDENHGDVMYIVIL